MSKFGAAKTAAKGVKKGWNKQTYDTAVTKVNKVASKTNKKFISNLKVEGSASAKSSNKAEKAGRGAYKGVRAGGKAAKGGAIGGAGFVAGRKTKKRNKSS